MPTHDELMRRLTDAQRRYLVALEPNRIDEDQPAWIQEVARGSALPEAAKGAGAGVGFSVDAQGHRRSSARAMRVRVALCEPHAAWRGNPHRPQGPERIERMSIIERLEFQYAHEAAPEETREAVALLRECREALEEAREVIVAASAVSGMDANLRMVDATLAKLEGE